MRANSSVGLELLNHFYQSRFTVERRAGNRNAIIDAPPVNHAPDARATATELLT